MDYEQEHGYLEMYRAEVAHKPGWSTAAVVLTGIAAVVIAAGLVAWVAVVWMGVWP